LRSGIAASAIAHLSILTLVVTFAEVHPFAAVTAEPIAVDIVSPQEVTPPPKPEEPPPIPKASDSFDLSSKSAAPASPPPAASKETPAAPKKQAALSSPRPDPQAAAAPSQPPSSPSTPPAAAATAASQPALPSALPADQAAAPPSPSASGSPGYAIPEPDVSVKYHVMLGLPLDKPGDGFDAPASTAANIESSLVTEFRRHLRTCSKLPSSLSPSDTIKIKLRVFMTTDGNLAAEPILIEASASAKGPALMQSAISALQACQPYTMLPADRYREWKMLDLSFTPQDFAGG
jgi:hypothetical protein